MNTLRQYLCLIFLICSTSALAQNPDLVILHTNDLHSMLEGSDGRGNFAKLAHIIHEKRQAALEQKAHVFLLDAGDFYGGTLYQILGPDSQLAATPEVSFLLEMNYDMVSLGNHEFDAGEAGLLTMFQKNQNQLQDRPLFFSTNIQMPNEHPLRPFIHHSKMVETPHGKIGLLALLGPDGARVSAPQRQEVQFTGFDDQAMKTQWASLLEQVQAEVRRLKDAEARFVIVVMHAGQPEDLKLAREVPGIDVIISGHTHQAYEQVLQEKGTWIAQAGCYGHYLGKLEFVINNDRLDLMNQGQHLIAINPHVQPDSHWQRRIQNYRHHIDKKIQRDRPYGPFVKSTPIADLSTPRERDESWAREVTSLLKDQYEKQTQRPVSFYFTSRALIRSGLPAGAIDLSDVFQVLSISMPEDQLYGAKTTHFYFTKQDVRKLIRFLFFYRRLSGVFTPAFSDDLTYEKPWIKIPYFREVTQVKWRGLPYREWPDLMPLATNSVVASYFPKIESMTRGLLSFTARDAQGQPLKEVSLDSPREVHLLAQALHDRHPPAANLAGDHESYTSPDGE